MDTAREARRAPEWQVWAALLIVYIVWGSTYLAIRVVDETMPPLLAAGLRHSTAAVILFVLLLVTRGVNSLRLSRNEWLAAGFVGLCLLLGGNGLVVLGERDVPSGLTALIIAVVPLFVVVLRRIFGESVATGTYVGVAGRVRRDGRADRAPRCDRRCESCSAMLMLVGASLSWAIGSYYSKRVDLPRDPLASTGAQMLVGGVSLAIAGALAGEWGLAKVDQFSTSSVVALAYLILFGSVLAYTAYTWVLQHASVSRVSTYAYVNPVVAIVLGAAILNETIDIWILLGAAIIVVSVALVIRSEARRAPADTATGTPTEAAGASPAASRDVLSPGRD